MAFVIFQLNYNNRYCFVMSDKQGKYRLFIGEQCSAENQSAIEKYGDITWGLTSDKR